MSAVAEPTPASLVVEAKALSKQYAGKEVVCGIDLAIPRGGCFGLLGPNGAGKTTTLRMILGLTPRSGGSLAVLGMSVDDQARLIRARTGVVPQADNLDPDFSVAENLEMYASYFGLKGEAQLERIEQLLAFAELSDRRDAAIRTLSGGMKRRLSIARALVNDPELVVLDEPTTGLDPQARHNIWSRLNRLKREGKTLLLTTHFMEEAERLCDDLVVIDRGHIIAQDSPAALIREHVEPEVFEISDGQRVDDLLNGLPGVRQEAVGDTRYIYAADGVPLKDRLQTRPEIAYFHRPANMEDVFLKLTGRDLRD